MSSIVENKFPCGAAREMQRNGAQAAIGVVLWLSQACAGHTQTGQPGGPGAAVDRPSQHASVGFQQPPFPGFLLNAEMREVCLATIGIFCFKYLTSRRNIGLVSVTSCQGFKAVFSVVKLGGWRSHPAAMGPDLLCKRALSSSTALFFHLLQ